MHGLVMTAAIRGALPRFNRIAGTFGEARQGILLILIRAVWARIRMALECEVLHDGGSREALAVT
jgi:hypothetical protein